MQQGKTKAFLAAASLLFAGVMLASCATVTPKPAPAPAVQPEAAVPSEAEQLNAQLNEIKTLLGTMQNTLSSQERSIGVLEQRINALERPQTPVKAAPKPENSSMKPRTKNDPALIYKTARGLLLEENFKEAAKLFKNFVTQHPDAALADNALYWLGECSYSLGEFHRPSRHSRSLSTVIQREQRFLTHFSRPPMLI